MNKGLIFFCCSCCILLLTTINLCIGPIISGNVGSSWGILNCAERNDIYKEDKDNGIPNDVLKYGSKWRLDECKRKKGMHDMEYTAFIFDIVIGYVCGLLGLLHYFELKKDFVEITGLIGLICGGIGFILTFVYVIFNGLVYTHYYDDNGSPYKTNGDGAFAEWKGDKYECFYFDKLENTHALLAKYSDLIKKQYNYNKDLRKSLTEDLSVSGCIRTVNCGTDGYRPTIETYPDSSGAQQNCKFLYSNQNLGYIGDSNKDKSDRFLTVLILSLFVCLANIGLIIFGFLMAKTGEFN